MRRRIRIRAVVCFIVSVSYLAYLKSNIHSYEGVILSPEQLVCFWGSMLLGFGSVLVLLVDGAIGLVGLIQPVRDERAKRRTWRNET
jgi:hypothetical protein